jgi:solute carrier family 44 (choline transporter-like protein), member 1
LLEGEGPSTTPAQGDSGSPQSDLNKKEDDPKKLKLIGYIFFGIAGLYLILLCCSYSRIKLAIAILKCSGRFMMENRLVLLIPPITFVISLLYFSYWVLVSLYLYSSGTVSQKDNQLPFGQFEMDETLK